MISPLTASLDAGGFDVINLDELEFDDAVADPTTTARLRRSGSTLQWRVEDARTNTTIRPFAILATTTGVAATSIGVGMRFDAESADEAPSIFGALDFVATDILAGSEDADFLVMLRDAGAATLAERFRVSSDGDITVIGGMDFRPSANSTTAINFANAAGTDFASFDTTNSRFFVPTVVGGTATTSDLNLQTTSGIGAAGADMHFLVGNNGATEAMTILNSGFVGIGMATPGAQLNVLAGAAGTISLIVDTAASPTAVAQAWNMNGTQGARLNLTGSASQFALNERDLGNNVAGTELRARRNSNAGAEGGSASTLNLEIAAGGNRFIWNDNSASPGVLRVNTVAPTGSAGTPTVSDTAGTVIGTQTSWWEFKQNISSFVDYQKALAAVVNTPLYAFDMNGRHYDAGYVIHKADVGKWFSWNDDLEKQQIPALNERQILGYHGAAIKELNRKIDRLEIRVQ